MFSQMRSQFLCTSGVGAVLTSSLLLALVFCGRLGARDDKEKEKEEEARRARQLQNMKRSAAQYSVSLADEPKRQCKFHESAVMRFSNPTLGTRDGALYIWSDRGRPQAILKLFTYNNEFFSHEWQSLSETPIVAEREGKVVWNPTNSGITFRELADAPKPAESAVERLRQMKSLAGKFTATYTDTPRDAKPIDLRLLIQPVFRFEPGDDPSCLDGAIFAFANGTAPPALLLLEARKADRSHKWYYAFARIASGAVAAKYDEKEIFSVEKYDFSSDPKKTFFWLPRQPVPKE
jgi:hypothetical protein